MTEKRIRRLSIIFLLAPILALQLFSTDVFGQDSKVISKDDAQKVLQVLAPDIKILSVSPAPVKGLWEVVVETRGRKSILYLDNAMKNVVAGSIIDLATRANLTKAKFDEINKVDVSSIPLDDALIMGNPKAKNRVIVFDDPV